MNTTAEQEFDYQTYMNEHAPDPRQINRGPKARQERRKAIAHNNHGLDYYAKGKYDRAIEDFTKAIEFNSLSAAGVYYNRGMAWLCLKEWDSARVDLNVAGAMGIDIGAAFHNDYESVADFEKSAAVNLPEDIAAMLTN